VSVVWSALFYLLSFCASTAMFYFASRAGRGRIMRAVLVSLCVSIPVLIASVRYDVGGDYLAYYEMPRWLEGVSFTEFITDSYIGFEPGSWLLLELSRFTTGDGRMFLALSSLITMVFFTLGFMKVKTRGAWLAYFLFLALLFPNTLNIVRQMTACAILFCAFALLIEGKKIPALLLGLLACMFHLSCYIALGMLIAFSFVTRLVTRGNELNTFTRKVPAVILGSVCGICVIAARPLGDFLYSLFPSATKIGIYMEEYSTAANAGNNYLFFMILAALFITMLLFRTRMVRDTNALYFTFAFINTALLFTGFFSADVKRLALYFAPMLLILISRLPEAFSARTDRYLVSLAVILFGVLGFVIMYCVLKQSEIVPYQTLFGR